MKIVHEKKTMYNQNVIFKKEHCSVLQSLLSEVPTYDRNLGRKGNCSL